MVLVAVPSAGLTGLGVVAILNERAAVEKRLASVWQDRLDILSTRLRQALEASSVERVDGGLRVTAPSGLQLSGAGFRLSRDVLDLRGLGPGRGAHPGSFPARVPPRPAELPQPAGADRAGAHRGAADAGGRARRGADPSGAGAAARPERRGPEGKGRGPFPAHRRAAGSLGPGGKVHRRSAGREERARGDPARRADLARAAPGIPAPGHARGRRPGGLRLAAQPAGLRRAARRLLRHAGGGRRVHRARALSPGPALAPEDRLREPGEPRAPHPAHLDPACSSRRSPSAG